MQDVKNSGIYGNSVLSSQLFFKSKMVLKQKVNLKQMKLMKRKKRKPNQTSTLRVFSHHSVKWKFFHKLLDTTPGASDLVGLTRWGPRISTGNNFKMLTLLAQRWYSEDQQLGLEDEHQLLRVKTQQFLCYLSHIYLSVFLCICYAPDLNCFSQFLN